MKASVYEYRDYKQCLIDLIESERNGGRGKRKALASAIGCQVSHITNVLSGEGQFSMEQAEAATRFFGMSAAETEYFLSLVQFNRAGTASLRKLYHRMLEEKRERYSALKNRLKMPDSLGSDSEARYYSSWQYGAVHVLLSIPQYRTREAVAERLSLPLPRVDEILAFLVETGLCRKEGNEFKLSRSLLHLDRTSPFITKHHTNWRLKTVWALDRGTTDPLHYSSVFTVSRADYPRVREILSKALADCLKVITASPEEEAAVIGLDCFRL